KNMVLNAIHLSTAVHSTLLDLPTEVLFKILQEPDTDQAKIAQVSRHLNSIVTYLFLSSKGIALHQNTIPSLEINISLDYIDNCPSNHNTPWKAYKRALNEDLSILATALDITAITHLSCTFNPISFFSDRAYLVQYKTQYTRLALLIQRLTHANKITLQLEQANVFHRYRSGAGVHDTWAESLNLLLNACVERGCQELEIWNGTWPKNDFRVVPSSNSRRCGYGFLRLGLVTKVVAKVQRAWSSDPSLGSVTVLSRKSKTSSPVWKGTGWEIEALTVTGPRIREASISQLASDGRLNISRLLISTPSLLLPPHSHWLYQLFNTTSSTLTSLTLHKIHLHELYWEMTFSWMMDTTLRASLEDLTISTCSTLPGNPLVDFINRMKRLKKLTLRISLPEFGGRWDFASERKRIDLPNLEEISAPVDFISILTSRPLKTQEVGV
ncbi:hypothetical protein BDN72DRAFT_843616, partial [Pluteus cervinus]